MRPDENDAGWHEDESDDDAAASEPQGYQALLDPDDDENFTIEQEEDEDVESTIVEEESEIVDDDENEEAASVDEGQPKPFSCTLCSVFFAKFEAYREHFVSVEHRYKRRDEKKRRGEGTIMESSPVETFVNLLLYNKVPFESVQIDVQPVDFSVSGSFEYNNIKYEHQHASSLDELYQILLNQFNRDYERHQFKMPPQSFFVARDVCRKEVDSVWTVTRYCDDSGKSNEQIVKELLDFCVFNAVEPERERSVAHSIQTWRMFHRQETKPGFWCDICKQCFRKRKAIICHFESSEKHEMNLKHLPPYRRAVQHSLFTGRPLREFVEPSKLDYYRAKVNAYRVPPSNINLKNAYYCTFCKKSFESTYALEKHLGWKGHRDLLRTRRQHELDNLPRLVTYLNFNQLSHEQRNGGIQKMAKSPDEYRQMYNLEPITNERIQEDILRFDTQLAQQVTQSMGNQQGNNRFQHGGPGGRGRGRGRPHFRGGGRGQSNQQQAFRPRPNFYQQQQQQQQHNSQYFRPAPFNHPGNYQTRPVRFFNNNNSYNGSTGGQFHPSNRFASPRPPMPFGAPNPNFANFTNKRPFPQAQNNSFHHQRQPWSNKRPRFDGPPTQQQQQYQPPPPNRIDYRYMGNRNAYQHQ